MAFLQYSMLWFRKWVFSWLPKTPLTHWLLRGMQAKQQGCLHHGQHQKLFVAGPQSWQSSASLKNCWSSIPMWMRWLQILQRPAKQSAYLESWEFLECNTFGKISLSLKRVIHSFICQVEQERERGIQREIFHQPLSSPNHQSCARLMAKT